MSHITSHYGNTNRNHSEILHPLDNTPHPVASEMKKDKCWGSKIGPSYAAGGNIKWRGPCGQQFGGSSKC